jgi:hypothetical protein
VEAGLLLFEIGGKADAAAVCGVALVGCSKASKGSQVYFNEHLPCPRPAVEQFEPWGQSGSQHSCKIAQGPFVAFESGHVRIRGQFANGEKTGLWRWYKADGSIEKEIDYSKTN